MSLAPKRALSFVSLFLFFAFAGPAASAQTVFRDRTAFEAAAQNLRTIDFDNAPQPEEGPGFYEVDGVNFRSITRIVVFGASGSTDKRLFAPTIGEITYLDIYLPPGRPPSASTSSRARWRSLPRRAAA